MRKERGRMRQRQRQGDNGGERDRKAREWKEKKQAEDGKERYKEKQTEVKTDRRNRWLHMTQSRRIRHTKPTSLPSVPPAPRPLLSMGHWNMCHDPHRPQSWGSKETTLQPAACATISIMQKDLEFHCPGCSVLHGRVTADRSEVTRTWT